ncbi:unnamed protein product [Caenorhabditis auriculariae]|uniref:Uncharacterized protein n=1 Tax=Caenorhabditis auriculariae TaxID=2777116 RepID=A0A8S1GYP0_9PELO|nr:unnamed protein product [Caenorhabditis auriculariae]
MQRKGSISAIGLWKAGTVLLPTTSLVPDVLRAKFTTSLPKPQLLPPFERSQINERSVCLQKQELNGTRQGAEDPLPVSSAVRSHSASVHIWMADEVPKRVEILQ